MRLKLFGVIWSDGKVPEGLATGIRAKPCRLSQDSDSVHLKFEVRFGAPGTAAFRFGLRFRTKKDRDDILVAEPNQRPLEPLDSGEAHYWRLDAPAAGEMPELGTAVVHLGGGLQFKQSMRGTVLSDNKGEFGLTLHESDQDLALSSSHVDRPFQINAGVDRYCHVNLATGVLHLDEGLLQLATGFTVGGERDPLFNQIAPDTPVLGGRWAILNSEQRELSFVATADPTQPLALRFASLVNPNVRDIPLHVGTAQTDGDVRKSLAAGAVARDAAVEMEFRQNSQKSTKIQTMRLVPRSTAKPFYLRFAGAFDAANRPAVFSCNKPLELASQLPTEGKFGSLVLWPEISPQSARVPVTCASDRVYGAALGHSFFVGKLKESSLHLAAHGVRYPANGPIHGAEPVVERLTKESAPFLQVATRDVDGCAIVTAQPGTAWAETGSAATARYELSGETFAVPLVPRAMWQLANGFSARLDAQLSDMRLSQPESRHESRLLQIKGEPVKGSQLFRPAQKQGEAGKDPLLIPGPGSLDHDFGFFRLRTTRLPPSVGRLAAQYTEILDNALVEGVDNLRKLALDSGGKFLRLPTQASAPPLLASLKGWPRKGRPNLRGLLKIGRATTLLEMLKNAGIVDVRALNDAVPPRPNQEPDTVEAFLRGVIDPRVLDNADWIGMVLFGVPLEDIANTFGAFIPGDAYFAHYLALEAARDRGVRPGVWARLRYQSDNSAKAEAREEHEAWHHVRYVDFAIADGNVSEFEFLSQLNFETFLGQAGKKNNPLTIVGRLQQTATGPDIAFQAQFAEPRNLLGEDMEFGPIRQVWVKQLGIQRAQAGTHIVVDGRVDLQAGFKMPLFEMKPSGDNASSSLDFFGLSLSLPQMAGEIPRLAINYPSLSFDASLASFELFDSLKVTLTGLGLHLDNVQTGTPSQLSWELPIGAIPPLPNWIATDLQFAFCELPELAGSNLSDLTFKVRVGLPFKKSLGDDNLRASLSALSFEPMRLNLARILSINASKLDFKAAESKFMLQDAEVRILDKKIFSGLTVAIRQHSAQSSAQRSRRSFYASWLPKGNEGEFGPFKFDWFLAGRGLHLKEDLARDLLQIPKDSAEFEASNKKITDEIGKSLDEGTPDNFNDKWLFAAGFIVGEKTQRPLVGRALFLDREYYGLSIRGRFFEELFDSDLVITGLYTRREPRERDSFYLAVTVPRMTFSTFQFTGGEVAIEIFANGDFMFDGGFPHLLPQGGRAWDRAFGLILTPFQGSGGFYIGKMTGYPLATSSVQENQGKVLALEYGYAVQAGLGACFKAGPVVAWATVGVYAIFSGKIVFTDHLKLKGIRILGAVGVLVRGVAQLDWWIISVRIEVVASAEMRGIIAWGCDENDASMAGDGCSGDTQDIVLKVAFELRCTVRASACIGSKPFRICKGISVSLPMNIQHCLKLGSM